ncbi:MAG: hypothetical protein HYY18_08290 [Planctomycetes bacterium]|nr:hypothetical protein [Planctomycetota bacterium]
MRIVRTLFLAAAAAAPAATAADPALRDPDPALRRDAFQFLTPDRAETLFAGPPEEERSAAKRAARELGDEDPAVRERATRALAALGDAGWEESGEALSSGDPEVARRAAEVRERLEKRLAPDRHWAGLERVLACRRLASAGRVGALRIAASDADARVRLAAAAGLTHCVMEIPLSLRTDPDPRVRAAAARTRPQSLPVPPYALVRLAEGGEWGGRLQSLSPEGDALVDGVPFAAEEIVSIAFPAAPEPPGPHRLLLSDGSILSGRFLELDPHRVRFAAAWGLLDLPRDRVAAVLLGDDTPDELPPKGNPVRFPCCTPDTRGRTGRRVEEEILHAGRHPAAGPVLAATPFGITLPGGTAGPWIAVRLSTTRVPAGPLRLTLPNGDTLFGAVRDGRFQSPSITADLLPRARLLEHSRAGPGLRFVACAGQDTVVALRPDGSQAFALEGLSNPHDVDVLPDGGVLVADRGHGRVVEFGPGGEERWETDAAADPVAAQRLPDGNTLITDLHGRKVVEVTPAGAVVWKLEGLAIPIEADRLPNGRTLLCEAEARRVVEVDAAGYIHWAYEGITYPADADRLEDGSTVITDRDLGAVLCVGPAGETLWTWADLRDPFDTDALPGGRFAVVLRSQGEVEERRPDGRVMKSVTGLSGPLEAE